MTLSAAYDAEHNPAATRSISHGAICYHLSIGFHYIYNIWTGVCRYDWVCLMV